MNISTVDTDALKPVIKELIQFYYGEDGNGAGGLLHIVLEDGNLEDEHIWWCQEQCEAANDALGGLIGLVLRGFTLEERESMYAEYWGMLNEHNN